MLLGYNTNGLAHHELLAAIDLLHAIGYRGVAITIDHHALNPYAPEFKEHCQAVRERLEQHGMRSVIETGARFLLDPANKHEPTLVSPSVGDRARRVQFLQHAIDAAAALKSDCVSFWSGVVRDGAHPDAAWVRLLSGLHDVIEYAKDSEVELAFEPEPGMFVDTMDKFDELDRRQGPELLGLSLDVGHLHCLGELPIADAIHRWSSRIKNVHIEDMRAGVHEHLMFGEGEMDFPPILAALKSIGYSNGVYVELSRHSHEGPQAARRAYDFLQPLVS